MYLFVRERGRPALPRGGRRGRGGCPASSPRSISTSLVEPRAPGRDVRSAPRPWGPGAGRSAKYYEPSDREFEVSIPERHYDVIGTVLLKAIEGQRPGERADASARRAASEVGRAIGIAERDRLRLPPQAPNVRSPSRPRCLDVRVRTVRRRGGARCACGGSYHALAEQSRDLVCGLNHELVRSIVSGLGNETLDVALEPTTGECCVQLRRPR